MNEARRDKRFRNRTSCRRRLQVGQGAELRCRAAPIPAAAAGNRSRGTRRGRRIRSTERGADHAFVGGLKRAGRRCCVRPWARGAREGGRCACRLRRRLQCASRQGARVEAGCLSAGARRSMVSKTGREPPVSRFFSVSGPVWDGKPSPVFYILGF